MAEPALEARGLAKSFGGIRATQDVSLALTPGETHALIGPNGAGKTTLVNLLSGELAPDAGCILLGGDDVTGLGVSERARRGLGRSFQITSILRSMSALENVALAVQARSNSSMRFWRDAMRERALVEAACRALDQVGLDRLADCPAALLAHGQKRQLELAMALALEPRVLLLDEPMAGMGAEESAAMVRLLAGLKGRFTILLVEHDMDAVFTLADRISVLVYGRIIATGTADEVRSDPDVRTAYLGEEAA
jgi:branched-chain amino acid transport system ATP-binding protein